MNKKKLVLYIFLVLSILTILLGIVLVICSFMHETLDEKYVIKEITEYTPSKKKLKKGEINVSRNLLYIKQCEYKITYNINYNREDLDILFSNNSRFTITDVIESAYKLSRDKVIINDESVKLYSYNTVTSDYEMNYTDNTFEISFPVKKIEKYTSIAIYIELKDREINKKYFTSNEAYYTFVPNNINNFYDKKTTQSYVIDGDGYILLGNK